MTLGILHTLGGLGLFLLGMLSMTDGLRGLAGEALQRVLRRFTRSPLSGAFTGAGITAIVQSSSATTVTAVGFAGAGILRFPEALGIVFGANLGTTVTGWMVALLGFKLELGTIAPLLVLLGVLLRLFARGRASLAGTALAGFGLVFIGIDAMRGGMAGLEGIVRPTDLPGEGLVARLELVAIGALMTVVTQSSSAGVAMSLAALSTGAIALPQAAALVIGMDIGTTVTAMLATIGASLPARRTGWAHVLFNLVTATLAFALLGPYFAAVGRLWPGSLQQSPGLVLVGFHSAFNLVGLIIMLPIAQSFARLVEWLVPERPAPFTRRLERSLLVEPEVALRAVAPTLADLATRAFEGLREQVAGQTSAALRSEERGLLALALEEVQRYLGGMTPAPEGSRIAARQTAALHVIDQLRRLLERESEPPHLPHLRADPSLRALCDGLARALHPTEGFADADGSHEAALAQLRMSLREGREQFRAETSRRATAGQLETRRAFELMDGYRWLERAAHHAWRITHHLAQLQRDEPTPPLVEPTEPA